MNLPIIKTEEHDRQKYIGGSDIAAILGISPWKTPFKLWQDKTTPPSDAEPGKKRGVFKRGNRWESVVAEMLVEALKEQGNEVEIVSANLRYRDTAVPYFASEIDYELRLNGSDEITNCELKTVHPFAAKEWGEEYTDEIPLHYTAQAMWGLGVTGRRECIVAPLFGADEIRIHPVLRDEDTIAAMRKKAQLFWEGHVLTMQPPDLITVDDADRCFRKEVEGARLLADPHLYELWLRARAINLEIKAREAEFETLEFQIKRAMGECVELIDDAGSKLIVWKDRANAHLDQARLKEEHPKLVKEFTVKGSSRVFTVK